MGKKIGKADVLQQKSPAEFFAENKNIAGFDNVSALRSSPKGTHTKRTETDPLSARSRENVSIQPSGSWWKTRWMQLRALANCLT